MRPFFSLFVMGQSALPAVEIHVCVQQRRIAYQNLVPIGPSRTLDDPASVDEHAVLALHVLRKIAISFLLELYT
jgi:hypothetical protein